MSFIAYAFTLVAVLFSTPVTYYNLSGVMRNGDPVHRGGAACGPAIASADEIASGYGPVVHIVEPDVWAQCTDTGPGVVGVDYWSPERPGWLDAGAYTVEVYR